MPSPSPRQPFRPLRLRAERIALAATLALGLAGVAQAQSLQALYDAARVYDATYQSARLQADAALYKADQSRALNRPSLSATGSLAFNNANTPYSSTAGVDSSNSRTRQLSAALTAQQSVFNRGNDKTITQAERAVEVAQSQLLAAEQDLIVRVAQAYFDVLGATDALATVRSGKRATAEQLASAKRNFEVGTATITDTREAQARYDLTTAQELAAENDLNVKRLALESVVGRSGLTPKPMAVPVVLPTLAPTDVEAWASQADDASPLLRQLRLARDVARLETEKARAGHLPTVGVSATLTEANTRLSGDVRLSNGTVNPFGPVSGTGLTTTVGVQVNVPIFSGYSVQNRIKETLALEDKAQSDLEAARRSVAQGTRSAYFGVRSLAAQVTALEAAESSNKLALEATQLGYKVGVRVNLDVLNAQAQLNQAQRDLAKARYDVVVNSLKLRQAAGLLSPPDISAVDALLAR
jgi:outer membrane protein